MHLAQAQPVPQGRRARLVLRARLVPRVPRVRLELPGPRRRGRER